MTERRRRWQAVVAVAVVVVAAAGTAGCSVIDATPDRIVVQFNSYYPGWAFSQASRHCGGFGREAVLVGSRPGAPSWETAFTGTTVQTFDCVDPAAAAGTTGAAGP